MCARSTTVARRCAMTRPVKGWMVEGGCVPSGGGGGGGGEGCRCVWEQGRPTASSD